MKKFFTLIIALAMVGATSVQAQVWQKSNTVKPAVFKGQKRALDNRPWWGYVEPDAELEGLGVQAADTYHCAIFVPGNSDAVGKTVRAIRFVLSAPNAKDVKVWLSSSLPATADAADIAVQKVNDEDLVGYIDATLSTPYTVTSDGVYVGYSFTISKVEYESDAYPIAFVPTSDAANALIIKTDISVPEWSDMKGQNFGRLYLGLLLEGNYPTYSVTPHTFIQPVIMLNESATVKVPVSNWGTATVNNVDYIITSDGIDSDEQHVDLSSGLLFGLSNLIEVSIISDAETGIKNKKLTITKVNGNANLAESNSVNFPVATVDRYVEHRVAVEENTGTGCGWCPRGLIGMDNLRKKFGDKFVGIGIHQYNSSDAMYINPNRYARLGFGGAPQCTIERVLYVDPYYGSGYDIADDFQERLDIPVLAGVEVEGTWNEDKTEVNATATVQSLVDGTNYNLEFVLVGDGLKGTGSAWNQANYYYQYTASQLPDDLAQFAQGGANGKSSITGWVFNDVALSSSYVSGSNMATGFTNLSSTEPASSSYTLSLPTKATLLNAIDKEQVYVIALLINQDGSIANAAKAKVVEGSSTGIANTKNCNASEAARYTLDGRQISAPQHGINIVKMSDGTVKKVMVK